MISCYSYSQIIQAIKDESGKINLIYSKNDDGRLISAVKENEYLKLLEKGLQENHSSLVFEYQPANRWWWDFRCNGIPFNLKLTTGGTDNAFNKVAIIYSITGMEVDKKNMNFNQFYKIIKESAWKPERTILSEYHYLVVNKNDGKILVKSILDIHKFKTNPCNILQINWSNELKHIDFMTPDFGVNEKIQELLQTIQSSVIQDIENKLEFAEANITQLHNYTNNTNIYNNSFGI